MATTSGVRGLAGYIRSISRRVWTSSFCQLPITPWSPRIRRLPVPWHSSELFSQSFALIQNSWKPSFAAASLMAASTSADKTLWGIEEASSNGNQDANQQPSRKPRVVFVLGGPGSGKGTQCEKLVEEFGFQHLSAGDLLRAEINAGSETGAMIQRVIKDGNIVPSEVTVKLIQRAMEQSKTDKFLIDAFPRNEENRATFHSVTQITPEFVLFLDCSEQEMERRLLGRNQERLDDNVQTIRRRFQVFQESSLPVVEYYESLDKVRKINGIRSIEDVFNSIRPLFKPFIYDDLLLASQQLLDEIDEGNFEAYKLLCDPHLTSFEPESQGHLAEGLQFHKHYLDQRQSSLRKGLCKRVQSTTCGLQATVIGNAGLVRYSRLMQKEGGTPLEGTTQVYNETRVWERRKVGHGLWEWRQVHCHISDPAMAAVHHSP